MKSYSQLTSQDKEDIKREQKYQCAICFAENVELVIDHDHETDAVRKALCTKCNVGLGFFMDEWNVLLTAACYVIAHKAGVADDQNYLRIGYKVLFEDAKKQEARQLANIRKTADQQLAKAKKEVDFADAVEAILTAEPAAPETSTSSDSAHSNPE
jgi:hypothetical protein